MVLTGGGPEDLNWKVATNQTYTGRYTVQFMRKRRRNRLKSHLFVNSNIFTGHPRHLQTSILFVPLTHTHSTNSWNLSGGEVTVFFFLFLYIFKRRLTGLSFGLQMREMKLQLLVVTALNSLIPSSQSEGAQQVWRSGVCHLSVVTAVYVIE